MITLLW